MAIICDWHPFLSSHVCFLGGLPCYVSTTSGTGRVHVRPQRKAPCHISHFPLLMERICQQVSVHTWSHPALSKFISHRTSHPIYSHSNACVRSGTYERADCRRTRMDHGHHPTHYRRDAQYVQASVRRHRRSSTSCCESHGTDSHHVVGFPFFAMSRLSSLILFLRTGYENNEFDTDGVFWWSVFTTNWS